MGNEAGTNEPTVKVEARLMRDGEESVMIFIKDAPVEIRKHRMPKTFDKLVDVIEKAQRT